MVVLDVNVLLAFTIPQEYAHHDAQRALNHWIDSNTQIVAPPLLHAEFTAVMRKLVYTQRLSQEHADEILHAILQLPIYIFYNAQIYSRALTLATQFNQPRAYDTQYLAVAEYFDCTLWTADERFVNRLRLPSVQLIQSFSV